ncbi:sulfatase [Streptomyces sp. NPDC085639]|uniref:sulfatase n=1 Tax=Streptomyces sp. NPDC085639 TaxID=3365734 RepID=UPI0037D2F426
MRKKFFTGFGVSASVAALMLTGLSTSVAMSGVARASGSSVNNPPNIIFILADDLGWADISAGQSGVGNFSRYNQTATLERLAHEGVQFTHATAQANCAPSRAALLSGQYAVRPTNNVYALGDLNRGGADTMLVGPAQGLPGTGADALPPAALTVAETLKSTGYKTGYFGKYHVAESEASITRDHGFDATRGGTEYGHPDRYHASDSSFVSSGIGRSLDIYAKPYTQNYVDTKIKPYAEGVPAAAMDALVGTDKHLTDAITDATIDFMQESKNSGPFFAFMGQYAVHEPTFPTEARLDLWEKYRTKPPVAGEPSSVPYAALIEGMDQSVERVVQYLESTPDPRNSAQMLADNTVVVFTSDNGGLVASANNGPLRGQKGELREGGIRVPMIAWSANNSLVSGGRSSSVPVNSVDYYPTFAAMAGASVPPEYPLDGVDLSALLRDPTATAAVDRSQFWHFPGYMIDGPRAQRPQSVIRSGKWKLVYSYETGNWSLYDLIADIGEANNRASSEPLAVKRLGTKLMHWLDDVNAPLARLRAGKAPVTIETSDVTYANGKLSLHDNEKIIVKPGDELPMVAKFPVGYDRISVSEAFPSAPLTANDQVGGFRAGAIRLAPPISSGDPVETRVVGQTFKLPTRSSLNAVTVRAEQNMAFGAGTHVAQLALMEDTDGDGIGDIQVGASHRYNLAGQSITAGQYISMPLKLKPVVDAGKAYHFELFWTTADPSHALNLDRSDDDNGAYANGHFVNLLDDTTFPAGSRLTALPRDLIFAIEGSAVS